MFFIIFSHLITVSIVYVTYTLYEDTRHVNIFFSPGVTKFVIVLIRAYSDEPVLLRAEGEGKSSINVVGDDPAKGLAFPESLVYFYDADLFDRLKAAFQRKNTKELSGLWSKAEHFEWNL